MVPITYWEALKYSRIYGIRVKMAANRLILKDAGVSCPFLIFKPYQSVCTIQADKPRVCKLYPFVIRTSPLEPHEDDSALYQYEDRTFYVYLQDRCRGIGKGPELDDILPSVIKFWLKAYGSMKLGQRR